MTHIGFSPITTTHGQWSRKYVKSCDRLVAAVDQSRNLKLLLSVQVINMTLVEILKIREVQDG